MRDIIAVITPFSTGCKY